MKIKAFVLKSTGTWYDVLDEQGNPYKCRIRGKLRTKGLSTTNPVAAGDWVYIEMESDEVGIATILDIVPRKNYIIRRSVNLSKEAQIVAANLDTVFLVVTITRPQTTFGFVDRFLVSAEAYGVPVVLLFHKSDQYDESEIMELQLWESIYQTAGYSTLRTSLVDGSGMDELEVRMKTGVFLFSGNSGVGKSSLIQHFVPSRDIRVGDISDWSEKGQHTTTFAEVFTTKLGSYIIDTPGIKGFGLVDIPKTEVHLYFPEMFALLPECRFSSCKHVSEPGCAVVQAVQDGKIPDTRYQSYLSIMSDQEEKSPYR
jgi:ribosome biogenesis GTPase